MLLSADKVQQLETRLTLMTDCAYGLCTCGCLASHVMYRDRKFVRQQSIKTILINEGARFFKKSSCTVLEQLKQFTLS